MKKAKRKNSPEPVALLIRIVWLEMLRSKIPWILLILAAIFVLFAMGFRATGIENPETATFLTNFGLTAAWAVAHILTMALAGRQLPNELEARTLQPLLARPISRAHVVLAKGIACTGVGLLAYGLLTAVTWLSIPQMESFSPDSFLQLLFAQVFSLGLLSALAILISLALPQGLIWVVAGGLVFLKGPLGALLRKHLGLLGDWTSAWLPAFDQLNLTTRFTDDVPALPWGGFLALLAHAALCMGALYGLAIEFFTRRRV